LRRLVGKTPDTEAWSEFVVHYGPRIFRWCRGAGLQEADAEDLTQDLLLKLASHMKTFAYDPTKSFHAWLKTITNNALIDTFERNRRAQELMDHVAAHKSLMQELQPEFDRELLEEAMARVELRVQRATWRAFRLAGIEGLSARDAAVQLGVPESRVRIHKGRVVKMIREEVRKLQGPDAE
jgi:RNA polymerase sigma-70 factor (ECF subfamily)